MALSAFPVLDNLNNRGFFIFHNCTISHQPPHPPRRGEGKVRPGNLPVYVPLFLLVQVFWGGSAAFWQVFKPLRGHWLPMAAGAGLSPVRLVSAPGALSVSFLDWPWPLFL